VGLPVRATPLQPAAGSAPRQAVAALQQAIAAAAPEALPALVGELEALKVQALLRLVDHTARAAAPATHDPLELLDVAAVARLCKLNPSTIYDHIRRGRLPVVPLGRAFRIRRADLERFVEERNNR
jgi:excisionase family DNA binding protein